MDDTSLLAPIGAEAPCGPDLEYDPAFLALESNLEAAFTDRAVGPEGEATGPDWKRISADASALFKRTKDLRVAVTLTKAWLNQDGVRGLHRGLHLVQQLLSLRWGSVHPQIGAQGDTEGIMRVNALRGLCDGRTVITPLRSATLLRARGLPALSLRDLERAVSGAVDKQSEPNAPDMTVVEASFIGCDLDELERTWTIASEALASANALEQLFQEHGTPAMLRLNELIAQLEAVDSQLGPRVRARRASLLAESQPEPELADAQPGAAGNGHHNGNGATTVARAPSVPGAINTRADVVRELDRICAYYDTHEPTSPVPMLLRRVKRLVGMSFFEIVRELAPSGMSEIETLRGPEVTDSV
ncbi:MAG TPA: type VI secretion system protein TssA [Polyangiales bacterium]|nr:type VI secretion system protein TssA [Polyangiales bacterium]